MHLPRIPELDLLAQKYSGGDTRQQRMIRLKMKEILAYYDECYGEEREFADEVTRRFCQLIRLLEQEWAAQPTEDEELEEDLSPAFASRFIAQPGGFMHGLMTVPHSGSTQPSRILRPEDVPLDEDAEENWDEYGDDDCAWDEEDEEESGVVRCPFETEEELLDAFFQHFRGTKSDLTLTDYCNRIRTFTKRYMMTIPQVRELYAAQRFAEAPEPVRFLYEHLDFIIAHFNTKKEDGSTDKQKLNLRSALRKLNTFKYESGLW